MQQQENGISSLNLSWRRRSGCGFFPINLSERKNEEMKRNGKKENLLSLQQVNNSNNNNNDHLYDLKWLDIYLFCWLHLLCVIRRRWRDTRLISCVDRAVTEEASNTWRFTSSSYGARHLCRLKSLPDKIWWGSPSPSLTAYDWPQGQQSRAHCCQRSPGQLANMQPTCCRNPFFFFFFFLFFFFFSLLLLSKKTTTKSHSSILYSPSWCSSFFILPFSYLQIYTPGRQLKAQRQKETEIVTGVLGTTFCNPRQVVHNRNGPLNDRITTSNWTVEHGALWALQSAISVILFSLRRNKRGWRRRKQHLVCRLSISHRDIFHDSKSARALGLREARRGLPCQRHLSLPRFSGGWGKWAISYARSSRRNKKNRRNDLLFLFLPNTTPLGQH